MNAKVLVGLPSTGTVRVETARDLLYTILSTPQLDIAVETPQRCWLHWNRERIVVRALELGMDYVWFIDSDMMFPPNTLSTLLSRAVDIVGVLYNSRIEPMRSIVRIDPEQDGVEVGSEDAHGKANVTIQDATKPLKCLGIGTGLALIRTSVFRKIPRPWFFYRPETEDTTFESEDFWFCDKAREHGFDVWVDPTIRVGHIGTKVY